MACKIEFEGKKYTKEQFRQFYDANKDNIESYFPFQIEGTEGSRASTPTLGKVKEWLKRIGVDIKTVSDIEVKGIRVGASGVARISKNLVEVVEGRENAALTEEAAHFAVELAEKYAPDVYKEMFNSIGNYNIWNETLTNYRNVYTKDGKPDIPRIKKEAIARLVTETIINKAEGLTEKPELLAKTQTWWDRVLNWLKQLFGKSTYSPFEEVASGVLKGSFLQPRQDLLEEARSLTDQINPEYLRDVFRDNPVGFMREMSDQLHSSESEAEGAVKMLGPRLTEITLELFPKKNVEFLQTNSEQSRVYDKLKEIHNKIIPAGDKENRYKIGDKIIKNRVTDLAKEKFDRIFKDKQINKTELQQAIDDLKRDKGTEGHKDMENIFHRYVDADGFLRDTPLPQDAVSVMSPNNNAIYETLEKNLEERLNSFPKGSRFLSEVRIYDASRDRAGTMDLVVIEPDGKTNILDWKFMELNTNKYDDVPWYKRQAFNIQIGEYRRILKDVYGVKQNAFGQTRAIPIQTLYSYVDFYDKSKGIYLSGVKIGSVNTKVEQESHLLPVALQDETTGNEKKDELIKKLNALYKQLSNQPVVEGRKDIKAAQLNSLYTAIRQLQLKDNVEPLLEQAEALISAQDRLIEEYATKFKGKAPQDFSPEEIEAFADRIIDSVDEIAIYKGLSSKFKGVLDPTKDKSLITRIHTISGEATEKSDELEELTKDFVNVFISQRVGIQDFLSPERVIKGLKRWFRSFSQGGTRALQAFYKLETPLRQKAVLESDEENKKLQDIRDRYMKWAKERNLTPKNMFDLLTVKDEKGRYVHERIRKFSKKFYTDFNNANINRIKKWFEENIDLEAYKADIEKLRKEKYDLIDSQTYVADPEENVTRKNIEKQKFEENYNLENESAWGNARMKKFPIEEKWKSEEYKKLELPENAPALEFYNYISERIKEGAASGAIEEKRANSFLPFMRKSMLDKIVFGGRYRVGEELIRDITVDESDVGYGNIDSLTGEMIPSVPFYFKNNLGTTVYKEDGTVDYVDYSNVSTDFFELMMLYNDQLADFKYRTSIENQVQLLLRAERLKESIRTNNRGEAVVENDQIQFNEGNEKNAEYLEKFIKNRLYGQRYVDSDQTDQTLGKIGNAAAKRINKFFGREIFPENLADRQISATRLLDAGNRWFQQKVLGLNLTVPIANLVGGTMQSTINAGKYITKADLASGWYRLTQQNFNNPEGQTYAGLLDYFLPLLDNEKTLKARKSSVSTVAKFALSDFLMSMQRGSDKLVQYPLAIALIDNTMIRDGKFVNIREQVKKDNNWNNRYNLSPEDRKALEEKVEKEIKTLKETQSLPKVAKIVDDELVIPNMERVSIPVANFREFIQQQAKNSVGNSTQEDASLIKMNVITNSFMVFKNWIPRLVDVRAGELRYQVGTDSWEYGRMRMMAKVLFSNMAGSIANLRGIMLGNERGINLIKSLYEKKAAEWKRNNGTTIELDEAEFIDMFRQGIRMEMKELLMLLGLAGMLFSAKAMAPDDDEDDEVKGFHKWSVRAIDKITDELYFYYLPTSIESIANGSVLPALGILTDVTRLVIHQAKEGFGLTAEMIGFEEFGEQLREKAHPQKYWMKTFPITKEISTYIPIFNKDLADDMGIVQTTQARAR